MAATIQVVLQQSVESLGGGGDVVKVRPGFARNYLIPRGLAVPATKGNLARISELKAAADAAARKEAEEAKALAERLEATSVKLSRAVGAENKMYGSVTSKDIEEAFAQEGVTFDRRHLQLPEPIKALGLHEVPIKLAGGVSATLRVEVIKQAG